MEKAFDLRISNDREELAEFLPDIDGRRFTISKKEFIAALSDLAYFLNNPGWMIYQWGSFLPISLGKKGTFILGLVDAIELGIALRRLSSCTNFNKVLRGFFNPTQFLDTRFELRVALHFLSLRLIEELVFAPEYEVRGRIKRPDFDAIGKNINITVECKSPNPFLSRGLKRLRQIGDHLKNAMELARWPDHLRLEINIKGPFQGKISSPASKLVRKALEINNNGQDAFDDSIVQGIVVMKESPLRMTDVSLTHDIMTIGQTSTGLLNPNVTFLRVTSSHIENQLSTYVGNCINGALKQLPKSNNCIIFIEEVPFKIAQIACQRRLLDQAYSHILATGVLYADEIKYIHRKNETDFIKIMQLD
jgi:hypothetical protein